MADNYTFRDAYGSVLTASSKEVSGAHQPIVQINSALGALPVTLSNSSVATLQGTNPWIVQLTSGSVITASGNSSVQVVGLMPPQSVSGVGIFDVNHTGNGSIITIQTVSTNTSVIARLTNSSVATLQGTNPWIIAWPTASIAGTYAEDTAHTSGERGLYTLAVRNDNVSSLVSANLEYSGNAVDSAGRTLTKPYAPNESNVQGVSSTVNTNPSSLLAVAGTGLRNYLTDILVANTGSVATLVSFRDGDASIIGRTIAPATSGSNIKLTFPMKTGGFNQQIEYSASPAVSVLHVSGYGYKAP